MPLRVRAGMVSAAIAAISPLPILLLYAPPDGMQRAEFAQFLGGFHPAAVHIPIALLLLVPLLECVALFKEQRHLRQSAGFVLGLAAAAAIISAWLGWILAWSGGYEGPLVTRHMWGGASLAAASLICWALYGWKRSAYIVALLVTLGLLVWTSDQGGKLTHGENFLSEHAPASLRGWVGSAAAAGLDRTSFYATRVQPIFAEKCVLCHNASKFKGKLRLDSYDHVMLGGKDGPVIHAGEPGKSELFRRVTQPVDSKGFMPAEGKPALSAAEIKLIEIWIEAGAKTQIPDAEIAKLPASAEGTSSAPLAPDYRPQSQTIANLESSLGIQLVPRSQNPTDGLILRTAGAPAHCDDAALAQLAPIANLIVDAELARTKITDKGMRSVASFSNLRFLDLSRTAVTPAGVRELAKLPKLESLNLTQTTVTQSTVDQAHLSPSLKKLYLFNPTSSEP